MLKLQVSNNIILNNIPSEYKKEYLGEGNNAKCYLTALGNVYKEFKYIMPYYDELVKISKFRSDILVYPESLVYVGSIDSNNLKGYIMKHIKGDLLSNLKDSVSILKYINELKKLERECFDLSDEKIILCCLHGGNIYWTNEDKLLVADVEDNEFCDELSSERVYTQNMIEISNIFLSPLLGENDKFKNNNLSVHYLNSIFYGINRASFFLNEALYEMQKQSAEEIKTIGDFKSSLKLILK